MPEARETKSLAFETDADNTNGKHVEAIGSPMSTGGGRVDGILIRAVGWTEMERFMC